MFVRTILPLSMPGLVSGSLLVFSVSMSAFVTPALMGGRRERNKAGVREAILRAAEVLFRTHGYPGTSMEQIARGVGVEEAADAIGIDADTARGFGEALDRERSGVDHALAP